MQTRFHPMAVCLKPEHQQALEAKLGVSDLDGRNAEVEDWLKPMMQAAKLAKSEGIRNFIDGFLLGYIVRGFDNALDFGLTEEEISKSIIDSYYAGLIAKAISGSEEEMKDTLMEVFGDE